MIFASLNFRASFRPASASSSPEISSHRISRAGIKRSTTSVLAKLERANPRSPMPHTVGFFLAASISPLIVGMRGSPSSFVTVTNVGNGASNTSCPSVVILSIRANPLTTSTFLARFRQGMPRSSASPKGTCALSQSEACRPQRTRSKAPILPIAAARTLATTKESVVSKASSCRRTRSSAPMARGFVMTSVTNDRPMEITVIVPPADSLICRAASMAFSSKPLTTGSAPGGGTARLVSRSTLKADKGVSGSSTCLAHRIILTPIAPPLYQPHLLSVKKVAPRICLETDWGCVIFGTDHAPWLFTEAKDLTVLPREPVHDLSMLLCHVHHLLALCVLVSPCPRNKGRALPGELLPDLLRLRSREENSEEVRCIGMVSAFKRSGQIGRRDHWLDSLSEDDGRALLAASADEGINERDGNKDLADL